MGKRILLKICDEDGLLFSEKDNDLDGTTVNDTGTLPETLRNYHYDMYKTKWESVTKSSIKR